jgi:hypothetical protein
MEFEWHYLNHFEKDGAEKKGESAQHVEDKRTGAETE